VIARLIALAAVCASCGHADDPVVAAPAPAVAPRGPIAATTTQLFTAIVDDWTSTRATLQIWQRDTAGWRAVGASWPGVVGHSGSAWGSGLHGDGPPAGHAGPKKHEGDRKSPAGVFAIRDAYGYAPSPPTGTRLRYTPVVASWKCVDDPASSHYDRIVDSGATRVDWSSAEDMRRRDDLYTWVVDVAHNPERKAGDGSCIFLHVWSGEDSSTTGCTAMAEPALTRLVAALDPARAPVYVLLPRSEYDALAPAWDLPAR